MSVYVSVVVNFKCLNSKIFGTQLYIHKAPIHVVKFGIELSYFTLFSVQTCFFSVATWFTGKGNLNDKINFSRSR